MQVSIDYVSESDARSSLDLQELADLLSNRGLSVQQVRAPNVPGQKDGGLVVGIAVASLVVSAINTLITALSFWQGQRSRYSVTISRGDCTVSVANLDANQLLREVEAIERESAGEAIRVSIAVM